MRYQMRHRLWSWTERFTISNAAGEPVGTVDRERLTWGTKLVLHDVSGREVARVERKVMSLVPVYEVLRDGHLCAVVSKEMFHLKPVFAIDVPGPDDLRIEGDLWAHEYFFVRGGKAVAQVSKQWWSLNDVYGVEVLDAEDHVLILAATTVVDDVLERENR